jgi:hypothetical protein
VRSLCFAVLHVVSNMANLASGLLSKGKVKLFLYRPWRPLGLRDVEAPTFFRHSAHRWRQGCQDYAPAAFYHQENSWYSFLLEAESTPRP